MKFFFLIIFLLNLNLKYCYAIPIESTDTTIRILHNNDMHSRFEEVNQSSDPHCSKSDKKHGKCYGGFARIATLVREARNKSNDNLKTFFLNAGDTYQGSTIFTEFKYEAVTELLNILSPDAASLGNHEFDNDVEGLLPFINNISFPLVTANLDLSKEPLLKSSKLQNYTILEANGQKIGVIGYLTPETKDLALTGEVIFLDEVQTIRNICKKLKKDGVDILIALGHSGFETDKRIAAEVEDIDLVIGGHTNTFLYTGNQPDNEVPQGLYPFEVIQPKTNRKTYVVQAYAYTKYLGNLTVTFDRHGEITKIFGNPILVDSTIPQADDVVWAVEKFASAIRKKYAAVIGKTKVTLDGIGMTCRIKECNLGNLATDAMIDYNVFNFSSPDSWTDAPIALLNAGDIRSSISRSENDIITVGDIKSVFPYDSKLYKVIVNGKILLSMLEHSINESLTLETTIHGGCFLQMSGLQVTYNISKPRLSRVVKVKTRCGNCEIPTYSNLDENKNYTILITDFMYNGGDGFSMLQNAPFTNLNKTTQELVQLYINRTSPVYPAIEGRITVLAEIIKEIDSGNSNSKNKANSHKINWLIMAVSSVGLILNKYLYSYFN